MLKSREIELITSTPIYLFYDIKAKIGIAWGPDGRRGQEGAGVVLLGMSHILRVESVRGYNLARSTLAIPKSIFCGQGLPSVEFC